MAEEELSYRLLDGRKVTPCWVRFECPACYGMSTQDAYLGAPLHMECPEHINGNLSKPPIMLPVGMGEQLMEQIHAHLIRGIPPGQMVKSYFGKGTVD